MPLTCGTILTIPAPAVPVFQRSSVVVPMPNTDRILVVEDDRDARETLYILLSREGYSVLTADNGQQGLDLLVHGIQPRLLIVDLLLPKVPGWDILKHAASDPSLRHMPVIVVTALSPDEVSVSADAVFHKPVDYPTLLTTVRRLMTARSAGT